MTAPATDGLFSPERRALTGGLLLGVLLIAFESMAVATVLPSVARDLQGLRLYGWSFSAFFMGFMLGTLALGGAGDRYGPRAPLLAALTLFALGLLVAGCAPNMPAFIAGRALQGLGGGGVVAVAYLAINRALPDALRARMLAMLSSAWVLPALIGPFVGAVLAEQVSWRAVFLGLLPLAALVALLTARPMGQVGAAGTPLDRARLGWALLAALGVTLTLAGFTAGAWAARLALALPGVALAVPALRALFPPGVLRTRTPLSAGYVTRFLLTFGFFGAEAFVPLALQSLKLLTPTAAGLALTGSALSWSACSMLQARFDERTAGVHRALVARVGVSAVLLSLTLTALALTLTAPAWVAGAAWALGGAGMGLAFQAHTLVVFRHAPDGQEGQVSGTLQTADVLGSAIGAGLGGAFVAALGVHVGVAVLFAVCACAAALGVAVTGRLRAPASTVSA
ncbi:MFS transporter [Deinococcus maricopensis]|uniref:Major facilitator superfamily MFS_1 n=1 Tax=Deinococcus maricopensis (strain DSM 21211 / LMG 22137 / NRRL B-23946 / LB-34) TaxID=709986 RepID=E8UBS7_DEIML|nr:MFS transporter [Deinococcus maricopensis]ADV68516.1 major facilitator superfamily MFS_1 [Deinococcus maricopensis DSM 21211]